MAQRPTTLPRKRPRQERAQATVRLLLEASAQIIESDGPEALTTTNVAERAGVSVGSVYQYFPNRESIFAALIDHYIQQLLSAFETLLQSAGDAPLDRVVDLMIGGLMGVYHRQHKIQTAIYEHLTPLGVGGAMSAALDRYVSLIERFLRSRRDLSLTSPRASAFVLVHAIDGIIRRAAGSPQNAPEEKLLLAEVRRLVLGHLSY